MSQEKQPSTIHLYNGLVTLEFDEAEHKYVRKVSGPAGNELSLSVDGVTDTLKIVAKPLLVPWAAKRVCEKLLSTFPLVQSRSRTYTASLPLNEFTRLVWKAKHAPRETLEEAGDIGTEAHGLIQVEIENAMRDSAGVVDPDLPPWDFVDERVSNCVQAAVKWMTAHNVKWLSTERVVYSLVDNYAGTMDGLCLVDSCSDTACCSAPFKNCLSIADWKSSKALYPEYAYQTAAYQAAYEEETRELVHDRWILRLGKDDGNFEAWRRNRPSFNDDWGAFLSCLQLTRVQRKIESERKAV